MKWDTWIRQFMLFLSLFGKYGLCDVVSGPPIPLLGQALLVAENRNSLQLD